MVKVNGIPHESRRSTVHRIRGSLVPCLALKDFMTDTATHIALRLKAVLASELLKAVKKR